MREKKKTHCADNYCVLCERANISPSQFDETAYLREYFIIIRLHYFCVWVKLQFSLMVKFFCRFFILNENKEHFFMHFVDLRAFVFIP